MIPDSLVWKPPFFLPSPDVWCSRKGAVVNFLLNDLPIRLLRTLNACYTRIENKTLFLVCRLYLSPFLSLPLLPIHSLLPSPLFLSPIFPSYSNPGLLDQHFSHRPWRIFSLFAPSLNLSGRHGGRGRGGSILGEADVLWVFSFLLLVFSCFSFSFFRVFVLDSYVNVREYVGRQHVSYSVTEVVTSFQQSAENSSAKCINPPLYRMEFNDLIFCFLLLFFAADADHFDHPFSVKVYLRFFPLLFSRVTLPASSFAVFLSCSLSSPCMLCSLFAFR